MNIDHIKSTLEQLTTRRKQPFTKYEACLWIYVNCDDIDNVTAFYSVRFLSKKFKWSRQKANDFLFFSEDFYFFFKKRPLNKPQKRPQNKPPQNSRKMAETQYTQAPTKNENKPLNKPLKKPLNKPPEKTENTPLTLTHKEDNLLKKGDLKNEKKPTRIPPDWRPNEKTRQWCLDWLGDADALGDVYDVFRDYYLNGKGKHTTGTQWDARFRNWIRKEPRRGGATPKISPRDQIHRDVLRGLHSGSKVDT